MPSKDGYVEFATSVSASRMSQILNSSEEDLSSVAVIAAVLAFGQLELPSELLIGTPSC